MINLIKFRKLKKQYASLEDHELLFIALLNGGVEQALTEGPEVVLCKSVERKYMKEDVENVFDALTERENKVLWMVLVGDASMKQVGKEFCVTEERVRKIFERGFDKVSRRRQDILTGVTRRNTWEKVAAQEREVIQEPLKKCIIERVKMQKEQREQELQYKLEQDLDALILPPACLSKLRELGLTTIGSLLAKFPYNMETNELEGFLGGLDGRLSKADYFDV